MKINKQILVLISFTGLLIAYHFFGYIGHYGYDDLHYAELANDFKNGIIDYNDHFSFRTPIIILTSVSYLIFGISDFASSLPTIFISVLILLIVFKILKGKETLTLILGLSLTTLSNWFIFYSDKLMPDMYVALSVLCSIYIFHQYRFYNKNKRTFIYSLSFVLALLFGFMAKGVIVLILPLLIFYLLADVFQKQNIRFWKSTMVIGIAVLFIYFLIIWLLTGEFFKRFEAIASNSYLNLCSYDQQSFAILFKRIAFGFFEMLVYQGMATGFIFVIAFLAGKRKCMTLKMADSFSFWVTSSVILLLSSNFMSISLTSYSPMCIDPRHYLFLVPVVSIPASIIIKDFIENKTLKIPLAILMLLVTVISIFLQGDSFWQLYFPLFLLMLIFLFINNSRRFQHLFVVLFIAILLIEPISMVDYAHKINYKKQKEIFTEYVIKSTDSVVVITNDVQKRLGNYFNSFKNNNITILNYDEYEYDPGDSRRKILFLNWYTRYLSGKDYNDLPNYAKNISTNNNLLLQNKKLNLEIYEMNDFSIPDKTGKLLLHSLNDFEDKTNYWNQRNEDISNEIKYEGSASNKVTEYSATFEYFTDSLDLENLNQLFISCKVYCNFQDKTNSKFVISVENKDGAYIYDGVDINKYIKSYSNWWPVKHEIILMKSDIKEKSKIKVYLWNVDKQKGYIDNFQVEIFGSYK